MRRVLLSVALIFSVICPLWAQEGVRPEKAVVIALPQQAAAQIEDSQSTASPAISYTETQLRQDKLLTERLLNQAIEQGNLPVMQSLLPIYRQFPQADHLLILFAQAQIAKKQQNYSVAIEHYRAIV